MAKALVVEDDPNWQGINKRSLEGIMGEGNVDIVASYEEAISLLSSKLVYDAYVLDGEFPRTSGDPEPLGIPLAKEIAEGEGSYEKIRLVSGKEPIMDEAQKLGIVTYTKGNANEEKGYRDIFQLSTDIKDALGL